MLKTVKVPPDMAALFARAEEVVSRFFQDWRPQPERGTIDIFGERYVLVRAASLSVEFFMLVESLGGEGGAPEANAFARNILFDLAHVIGKSDARNFQAKMGLDDPIGRLSAGPVHFAHTGWAFVDILPESRAVPDDGFCLVYDHPYSFEADAWLRSGLRRDFPVCIMSAGYSSGWCEESFGLQLVSSEVLCRAQGDDTCRFIMAPPSRIQSHIERFLEERPALAPRVRGRAIPNFFERKRAEEEIKRLYARLQETNRLQADFFANVSHELRTPLTLILGLAQRLLDRAPEGDRRDLEIIRRNARVLLLHVNDLLEASKLDSGSVPVEYAVMDVAQETRLVASSFEVMAAERGVTFDVDAPPGLLAELDGEKLQRIVSNMLSNAFKFTPDGGTVRIAVEAQGDEVLITVDDSGPGVPEAQRAAIFERFVTVGDRHPARGDFGSTGLGLSIARELAALQRGTLSVGDAPLGGARFTLTLPRTAPPGTRVRPLVEARAEGGAAAATASDLVRAAVDALAAPLPPAPLPPPREGLPSVLIVEDNPEMRQFIAEGLASEHRVACASDGAEGLELARTLVPDAIVTDVMMPKLGGDAMVRAIRADPALADIPIIVLTAKADDALRVTLLRQGAQDYIMKPFALDELRARLANLLTMKRARDLLRQQLQSESSDLAELAAQMAERDRQLTTAVESLAVARDQAERASQAKTRFLGLVSHELRTPLTVLHLQLERLRVDPPDNPQHRDIVRRMALSTARLRDLIESLLHSARVESGRLSTTIELVDLARLCADVVEEMRPFAEHRRLALSLSVDPALPAARTDARLVRLVLVNLCANAIKFTDKGSVEVTARAVGDELHLAVKDSGPGIAECDRLRIFEPFRQLEDIVHKHTPGVGLGLAISQQIAAALGGRIELDSTVGEGSTFRLVMPRGSD